MKENIIIIGGGPAGITAAIQLARYGHTVRLFESGRLGGMLWEANLVENYPGFPKGIAGPRLARLMEKHLAQHPVEVIHDHVAKLEFSGRTFRVKSAAGNEYRAKRVVLATGTVPGPWELPRISGDVSRLVYREVYPLTQMREKRIAIIGGGDAAFDYAMNLARHNQVILCSRNVGERSLVKLRERVEANEQIEWHRRSYLGKIERVEDQLRLSWLDDTTTWTSDVDALLSAVGRVENSRLLEGLSDDKVDKLQNDNRLKIIGDLANERKRQTAIAVGDGMRSAMEIETHLAQERVK